MIWLLLIGTFTYIIVQRSVANLTKTPVWLLVASDDDSGICLGRLDLALPKRRR